MDEVKWQRITKLFSPSPDKVRGNKKCQKTEPALDDVLSIETRALSYTEPVCKTNTKTLCNNSGITPNRYNCTQLLPQDTAIHRRKCDKCVQTQTEREDLTEDFKLQMKILERSLAKSYDAALTKLRGEMITLVTSCENTAIKKQQNIKHSKSSTDTSLKNSLLPGNETIPQLKTHDEPKIDGNVSINECKCKKQGIDKMSKLLHEAVLRLDHLEERMEALITTLPEQIKLNAKKNFEGCYIKCKETQDVFTIHTLLSDNEECMQKPWNKPPAIKPKSNFSANMRLKARDQSKGIDNESKNPPFESYPATTTNEIEQQLTSLETVVEKLKLTLVRLVQKKYQGHVHSANILFLRNGK